MLKFKIRSVQNGFNEIRTQEENTRINKDDVSLIHRLLDRGDVVTIEKEEPFKNKGYGNNTTGITKLNLPSKVLYAVSFQGERSVRVNSVNEAIKVAVTYLATGTVIK